MRAWSVEVQRQARREDGLNWTYLEEPRSDGLVSELGIERHNVGLYGVENHGAISHSVAQDGTYG